MNANDIIEKCASIAESEPVCLDAVALRPQLRIAKSIRALKSSLPAEAVSEAMMEDLIQTAIEAFDNVYDAEFRATGIIDNKPVAMRAAVESVIAALAHADDGWRPIESAPKDGTTILVSFGTRGVHAVAWCEPSGFDHEIWCVDDGKHGPYALRGWNEKPSPKAPTHWRPLPAPPKDGRE